MTTLHESVPRRWARWLWLVLTGVLLMVAIEGFCCWWFVLKPSPEERRPFVGTWRLESPSPIFPARPELVEEKDLMFDGTIIDRLWDPQTGAVAINQASSARWQVSNGRYQEVIHGGNPSLHDLLHDLVRVGGGRYVLVDSPVTWEGPNRFQVQGASPMKGPDRFQVQGTLPMTWSRCEGVTGLPRTYSALLVRRGVARYSPIR